MAPITPEQLSDHLAAMKAAITFKPVVTPRVLDNCRWSIELERKFYHEDRIRWEKERHNLNRYITGLEFCLTLYQDETLEKHKNPENPETPYVRTGKVVWSGTGGQSGSKPTKSFEVPTSDVPKQEGSRGKIAESGSSKDAKATFVMGTGISVPTIDQMRDFDGILFKENIRAPPIAESFERIQSLAPDHWQSVARGLPATDANPRGLLPSPILPDGTDAGLLPKVPPEWESTPESSREDVPSLEPDEDSGDVELKGPLGLKNNNVEDKVFLRELDSKLNEAANVSKTRDAHEGGQSMELDPKDDADPRTPERGNQHFSSNLP